MRQASGRDPVVVTVPLYGAGVDVAEGALIMLGATADTDLGLAIVGASGGTDAIGTLVGKQVYATSGDSALLGTKWVLKEVELADQYTPLWVEYDQTDTMAVASTSTTTVTVTSLEDNIDLSWLYAVSGTGVGKLAFVTASASGSCTTKTATAWDSTTVLIKILRFGHQVAKLNTAGTKIGTDAAAGSWTVCILESHIVYNGKDEILDPTKHDNVTFPGAKFYAKLLARNTCGHSID